MPKILKDHQKNALRFFLPRSISANYMQMRLGKSVVTIRKVLLSGSKLNLVVAPYSAIPDWEDELRDMDQDFTTVTGDKPVDDILNEFASEHRWFLVNKELHRKVDFSSIAWQFAVIDESTTISNPRADITKYFMKPVWQLVPNKMVLSGNPAPEEDLQYYCQLYFLNKGIFPFKNYWDFRMQCFVPNSFGFDYKPNQLGIDLLSSALKQHAFFFNRKDANLGGIKIHERRYCKMPPEVRQKYNQVVNTFTLEEKRTIYATQKFLWLRQLASGFSDKRFIDRFKTLELQALMREELQSDQVIIFCDYTWEVDTVHAHFDRNSGKIYGDTPHDERKDIIARFRRGELQNIIAQPETLKWGKDLHVCDTIVIFSSPLGGESRSQVEDRGIHMDKNESTLIIDLLALDSIDEDIYDSLIRKESKSEMMQRIVKRLNI